MATVQSVGLWTILLGPVVALTWAVVRCQRRRQFGLLSERAVPPDRVGEISEAVDAARGHPGQAPEQRERAMRNLVGAMQNEDIEADMRIQLIQDLVDLGGEEIALRLNPVIESSDVDIEVRLEAAEHLGRCSPSEGARALEAIATDTTVGDQSRLDAASALVDCSDRPARIALMRLVTDDAASEYVRHGAANMLRRVDRSSAAMAFGFLAASPLISPRLRIICAEQLADDDRVGAIKALWRLIKGVESIMDYNLGIDAADTLHGICPDTGIEAFSSLAVDSSFPWHGRIEAAYRLGRLGVNDGYDLLSDFARAEELDNSLGLAALDRLFQLEIETGTLEADD